MNRRIILKTLLGATVVSGVALTQTGFTTFANDGQRAAEEDIQFKIESSCMLSASILPGEEHTATIANGTYQENIGTTTISTICNDAEGFSIYAVGFGSDGEKGRTDLTNADGTLTIATGTATSGNDSAWAMKVTAVEGNYTPTVTYTDPNTGGYKVVPSTVTEVAKFTRMTDRHEGSSITTTYRGYISPFQPAGVYVGAVKYMLSHPTDDETGGIVSIDYMQDMTPEICAATSIGAQTILTDRRDGKYYIVSKLKDGNCWMSENLRFSGIDREGNEVTLDSTNTDNPAFSSLQGSTPTGEPYELYSSWTNTNLKSEYYPDDAKTNGQYYGYYYNWYAATAGTSVVNGTSIASGNATGSICPKGWTLPSNTGANSYQNLMDKSGVTTNYNPDGFNILSSSPMSFLRAGYHNTSGTGVNDRGSAGRYWSATAASATNARALRFGSTSIYPQNGNDKANGFTVRCVAR